MLARIYFIAGSLLLAGYGLTCWEGWEFGDAVRLSPAPPAGTVMHSSTGGGGHSSSSRSGWVIFGGK
jgi:hypothetical protein